MNKERLLSFSDLEEGLNDTEKTTTLMSLIGLLFRKIRNFCKNSNDFCKKAIDMGRKDPRKIIHAVKFGLALSLVSLLIFFEEPSDVSQFWIWAILTVIVMFEFSVGATFIKGFNRGFGTFCAGMIAFFFAWLSLVAGQCEKVVIVISFFITGAFAYYLKLYPTMAPYEYGYRVFVLTFCILMVAGNRTREYTEAIFTRLVLIGLGALICLVLNILIYPIWSGDDLHRLIVNNFKELASSLEDCVKDYVKCVECDHKTREESTDDQLNHVGYKNVIESASREQILLGCAIWEPPHGRYRTRHYPWKSYVKLSNAIRHCSYSVMALHGCILSEIQAPYEKRRIFRTHLERVSSEGAKVLREIGNRLDKMEKLNSNDEENILTQVHKAAEQLQKKIDRTSYVLVNSENWEIKSQTKNDDLKQDEHYSLEDEHENMQYYGLKCLSETAIQIESPLVFSASELGLSKHKLRKIVRWPSRVSLESNYVSIEEDEMKTYESASALSLATFVSILIEFVARLQNVVDCFEELSEEAKFRDPNIVVLTESGRFWTRLFRIES